MNRTVAVLFSLVATASACNKTTNPDPGAQPEPVCAANLACPEGSEEVANCEGDGCDVLEACGEKMFCEAAPSPEPTPPEPDFSKPDLSCETVDDCAASNRRFTFEPCCTGCGGGVANVKWVEAFEAHCEASPRPSCSKVRCEQLGPHKVVCQEGQCKSVPDEG